MAAPTTRDLTKHLLELARILKVLAVKQEKWFPSEESREVGRWIAAQLDELRAALERE